MRGTKSFLFGACLVGLLALVGCRGETQRQGEPAGSDATPASAEDRLARARQRVRDLVRRREWDKAARKIKTLLVAAPQDTELLLLASQIESLRGHPRAAIETAEAIGRAAAQWADAIEVRAGALGKLKRYGEAGELLTRAADSLAADPQQGKGARIAGWRFAAWQSFNRVGRRHDASRQADWLCRAGRANAEVLISLISRGRAFPLQVSGLPDARQHFEPGLGLARWHFTHRRDRQALEAFSVEEAQGTDSPEGQAFRGRLLARNQAFAQLIRWHRHCDNQVRRYSDYWAALGIYFAQAGELRAAARALLEAVVRDPSDDDVTHRLASVFRRLGRGNDAREFRARGVSLVQLSDRASVSDFVEMPQRLIDLGRPFEGIAWSLELLPPGARRKRIALQEKYHELLRDKRAMEMPRAMARLSIDRQQFPIAEAIADLGSNLDRLATVDSSPPAASSEAETPIVLAEVAPEAGLLFRWYPDDRTDLSRIPIHEMMGGGLAVLDYDLDGWPDVYCGQGSGDPPSGTCTRSNQLFRNFGGRFRRSTDAAGAGDRHYSSGIACGDVNQDGFPDIYLGSLGRNRLLLNNGDGTFRDAAAEIRGGPPLFTASLAIADLNGDALPDLYETAYIEMEGGFVLPTVGEDGHPVTPSPAIFYAQPDRWWENLGDGRFAEHLVKNDSVEPGSGLGVMVTDFDGDRANEVFVANDMRPNQFLSHDLSGGLGGGLANSAPAQGLAYGFNGTANACMGIAAGDFDRSGTCDLHVTNFTDESSNLFLQQAGGLFVDRAVKYGLDPPTRPWVAFGTKALDWNRDGWLDLIVSNGHIFDERYRGVPFRMPPQLLVYDGDRFREQKLGDRCPYWAKRYLGRAVTRLDYNRDHRVDVLVGHLDRPVALLENQTTTDGHWVQLELVGTRSERGAIGTVVRLRGGGASWSSWVTAGDGYLSSDEPFVDVGLGDIERLDAVEIVWPSGERETFETLATDRRYLIVEGAGTVFTRPAPPRARRRPGRKNAAAQNEPQR